MKTRRGPGGYIIKREVRVLRASPPHPHAGRYVVSVFDSRGLHQFGFGDYETKSEAMRVAERYAAKRGRELGWDGPLPIKYVREGSS